eukprot:scaffold5387_cov251-Ochromonas_danica.AAC.2
MTRMKYCNSQLKRQALNNPMPNLGSDMKFNRWSLVLGAFGVLWECFAGEKGKLHTKDSLKTPRLGVFLSKDRPADCDDGM